MNSTSADVLYLMPHNYVHLDNDVSNFHHIAHGATKPTTGLFSTVENGCCIFTNDGRGTAVGLKNTCGKPKMAKVLSYDNGTLRATRFIHLQSADFRYIRSLGNQEFIDAEFDWDMAQGDDGSSFVKFDVEDVGSGWTRWNAHNLNPRYFNAIEYDVFKGGKRYGTGQIALAPGASGGIFPFGPTDNGFCFMKSARLDPL